jgi:hypothetical protein
MGNSLVLLETINVVGSTPPFAALTADIFFEHNQSVAFIGVV